MLIFKILQQECRTIPRNRSLRCSEQRRFERLSGQANMHHFGCPNLLVQKENLVNTRPWRIKHEPQCVKANNNDRLAHKRWLMSLIKANFEKIMLPPWIMLSQSCHPEIEK